MADSLSPEEKARLYLKEHRIMEILNYLTFQLLYHRPDKPREFLQDMLSRIKIAKITSVDFPYLIDDSNLVSMFEIMDPTNQGFITPVQYKEALKNLGLLDSDEVIDENLDVITKDYFRKNVARKTLKMWLSF